LVPLLGLFFEVAVVITQKPILNKISGSLVILGSLLAILAGLSGFQQFFYLKQQTDVSMFNLHYVLSTFVFFGFLLVLVVRSYLMFKENQKLATFYIFFYTVLVMVNLISNEIVVHAVRGE